MSLIEAQMAELRAAICRHDYLYYVEARPTISDAEYDALWNQLEALEKAHPEFITPDSPTQRVSGEPMSGFKKVRHDPPMRSLDKTYTKGDLADFERLLRSSLSEGTGWDYVVEPKVDGLSLSLLYRQGILVRAATRGNGEVGDDITANVKTIRSIPLRIPTEAALVEVRGEIYMTREGFAELNRQEEEAGNEPFANPRNAAAGSIKLLDPREVAKRPLDAILYAVGALEGVRFGTHLEMIRTLAEWGFRTPPWRQLCMDMPQVLNAVDELEKLRHTFPFEIDGAVVKVNQLSLYAALGSTAHAPRSARAYKYAPETAQTLLRGITVQVGRTGVLTPVAELEPVALAGSVIARATLHNAEVVREKDVRIGDTIIISKHGDVIPAVDGVVMEKRPVEAVPYEMPMVCPACGSEAEYFVDAKGEKGKAICCVNPECSAQRVGHLQLFVSRNALDISALGTRMAEALVQAGVVTTPLDLYDLRAETLEKMLMVGEDGTERVFGKRAQEVVAALEKARELPLNRWIYALGIPNIGEATARHVAKLYPDFASMRDTAILEEIEMFYRVAKKKGSDIADKATHEGEVITRARALESKGLLEYENADKPMASRFILTIKPEVVRSLLRFLTSAYAERLFVRMEALGINPKTEAVAAAGTLQGKSFVITGTLSKPRTEVEALIRAHGGTVQNSVSKKTDYLITGADPGGSKYTKAQSLGTPMLNEQALLAMLAEQSGKNSLGAPAPNPGERSTLDLALAPLASQTPQTNNRDLDVGANTSAIKNGAKPNLHPNAQRSTPNTASEASYVQDDLFG